MESPKRCLLTLILEKSYREGQFTLTSGQKSNFYIDLKPALLTPKGAQCFGECVVEWLKKHHYENYFGGVAGLTLGADPMVMAVSMMAYQKLGVTIPAAIIRKEVKAHGSSKRIEGIENLDATKPILILEDVVSTGGSALKANEALREAGFKTEYVLSGIDREMGGEQKFKEQGLQLTSLFKISEIQAAYRAAHADAHKDVHSGAW